MKQSVTFVSALIDLHEDRSIDKPLTKRIELFQKLASSGICIYLYISPNYEEIMKEIVKDHKNIRIVKKDITDTWTYKTVASINPTLPETRTIEHDTLNFMTLMNAKAEFVYNAISENPFDTTHFAWIDFNICHVFKNMEKTLNKLHMIGSCNLQNNFITFPGCWTKPTKKPDLYTKVNWRFCGGFFIGDRDSLTDFFIRYQKEFPLFLRERQRIVWEVNFWALLELSTDWSPEWYQADHNDTLVNLPSKYLMTTDKDPVSLQDMVEPSSQVGPTGPVGPSPFDFPVQQIIHTVNDNKNKIILVTMVKNEEKVLERLIDSTLFCVDAVLVSDTGSTDGTHKVVEKLSRKLTIPVHLAKSEWKHFGYNRTQSFLQAQEFCNKLGWDPKNVWGLLLDGDMILYKGIAFDKEKLDKSGYMFIQKNDIIDYFNTRLVRLSNKWTCVGVTHEYWDGPNPADRMETDHLWIKDIGDGGCKGEKFERDILLLEQGIKDEPNNVRYYFYLAQSYKDIGNFKKAIELYKIRIVKGGWSEEVWHSHYMIAKCWKDLGAPHKAELWGNKAYNYRRTRAEPIYMLTEMFRNRGENFKAYHYYQIGKKIPYPDDVLFIEKNIYTYLFDYEFTIIQYYTQPMNRMEGAKASMRYVSETEQFWGGVFSNFQFYSPRLCEVTGGKWDSLHFDCPDKDFKPSSISLLKYNGRLMANVRFVNYIIDSRGAYQMRENGIMSPHHNVRTKNGFVFFTQDLKPSSELIMMKDSPGLPAHNVNIRGLEDVRLFEHKKEIYYTATTKEYSPDNNIRIMMGRYDFREITYKDSQVILPPVRTVCEKNWIATSGGDATEEIDIIYKWHPLEIGRVKNGKLEIIIKHDTPYYFHNVRGSSSLIEFEGALWCVTHSVIYTTPRKYLHNIVVLEKSSYKLLKYSLPVCFTDARIEYCLGFVEMNGNFIFTCSIHDANPRIVSVPIKWVKETIMDWS